MQVREADQALLRSLEDLCLTKGMLTGLSVSFGTRDAAQTVFLGHQREVVLTKDGFVQSPLPVTANTVYDLASLTKAFTLVAVLMLLEDGKLSLCDDIARLDPRFAGLSGCTVEDCLTYRAVIKTPKRVDEQEDADAAESMVFESRLHPISGSKLYSDMNALVLKYVVEALTGEDFYSFLKQRVLSPLQMEETWIMVPEARKKDLMDYRYEHRIHHGTRQVLMDPEPGLPHDPKARLLGRGGRVLSGHAGLFSTAGDVCRFARGLLSGALLPLSLVRKIGVNQTGYKTSTGEYRQFLGWLCFSKSPVSRLSEVPGFMGLRAFGLSGYTGNHLAIDPDAGVFDLLLGNRCHHRLSVIEPAQEAESLGLRPDGSGEVVWEKDQKVKSSFHYVYQKDALIHEPVRACLKARGWLRDQA